jgi:cell wall-associated NlpC family hydrolase
MINEFSDLVGMPYVRSGRDPAIGLDCWGLCMEVYRRLGRCLPDLGQVLEWRPEQLADWVAHRVPKYARVDDPTDADCPLIAVMRLGPRFYGHTGVLLPGGRIIHAFEGAGVVIQPRDRIAGRTKGFYRVDAPC